MGVTRAAIRAPTDAPLKRYHICTARSMQPLHHTHPYRPNGICTRTSAVPLTFLNEPHTQIRGGGACSDFFVSPPSAMRADGLTAAMRTVGWSDIIQIDNSGELGGGWSHERCYRACATRNPAHDITHNESPPSSSRPASRRGADAVVIERAMGDEMPSKSFVSD